MSYHKYSFKAPSIHQWISGEIPLSLTATAKWFYLNLTNDFGDASVSNVLLNDVVSCCAYVASVTYESVRSIGGITLTLARGNQKTKRKTGPSATVSTAQSTQTGPTLSSASQQENNSQMWTESRQGESSCALDLSWQMSQNFNIQECLARVMLYKNVASSHCQEQQ